MIYFRKYFGNIYYLRLIRRYVQLRTERLWGSAKWGNKKRRGGGTNRNSYLAKFVWRIRLEKQDAF